jgi:hypothetical protein
MFSLRNTSAHYKLFFSFCGGWYYLIFLIGSIFFFFLIFNTSVNLLTHIDIILIFILATKRAMRNAQVTLMKRWCSPYKFFFVLEI